MTPSLALDPLHLGLAALSLALLLGLVFAFARGQKTARGLHAELTKRDQELESLKNAPQKWEFSAERFDVVWFPSITTSPASKEVTQVSAGVPHCKACLVPLSILSDKDHSECPRCNSKFASSFANLMVLDSITKLALQYFQSKHPGYKVPPHLAPAALKRSA